MSEISTKPYLLRAIHEWCSDSGFTPYIAVSVDDRTVVPADFVRAGEIVLNISLTATNRLTIGNELIEFQARFGGVGQELSIPVENVSAIYARENGHGMSFDVPKPLAEVPRSPETAFAAEEDAVEDDGGDARDAQAPESTRPALAAVPKSSSPEIQDIRESDSEPEDSDPSGPAASEDDPPPEDPDGGGKPGAKKRRGKPKLTRVK